MGEQGLADDGVSRNNTVVIAVLVLGRELSYAAQVALERERLQSEVERVEAVKTAYEILKNEVAERQKAEQALRDNERFLTHIFDSIQDGLTILDAFYNIHRVNPTMERWFPRRRPLIGKKCYAAFHGRRSPCKVCPTRQTLETGAAASKMIPVSRDDGTSAWVEIYTYPLMDPDSGKINGVIEYVKDVSERVRTEEALRRSEEQLRQSQKMEAVGRLAGGIAHDFNNILTALSGYSELLMLSLGAQNPLSQDVQEIQRAADRAATLTQQLLAFSRKQIINPQPLHLNEVVVNMDKMLRRLIRENVHLQTILDPELGAVLADRSQIEQVVVNLVVNAQDAMPQGGRLTLETANVDLGQDYGREQAPAPPGPYVRLTVSDTGIGMDRETREHLFEPFFTTKKRGEGTGLGLSMTYAIVNQGGGFIEVDSEPGQGAALRVYLPRLAGTPEPTEASWNAAEEQVVSETILLAEDEEIVRQVTQRILAGSGYTVLEAGSGPEALKISEQYQGRIHLVLTDVLMPEMTGPQLAAALTRRRPEMKVLFMSGHADDVLGHHGVLEPGIAFIQKPFRRDDLLRKLQEVLSPAKL
jgi:PAS domain S-box-containing protein